VCLSAAVPGTPAGTQCEAAEILCTDEMTAELQQATSVPGTLIIPEAYR
jgi:hypothetical protein